MQQITILTKRSFNCWQQHSFNIKSTFGDNIETRHLLDTKFMNMKFKTNYSFQFYLLLRNSQSDIWKESWKWWTQIFNSIKDWQNSSLSFRVFILLVVVVIILIGNSLLFMKRGFAEITKIVVVAKNVHSIFFT